jgi:MoaA/NifB/PqqE/SkfB family radical SAM enzyme
MKTPHDKFCVLPWVSLEASPIGTVRPCCLADDEITDNQGHKFNLATSEFGTIQHSDYMQNLRKQFLDQQQPQTCRKCWNEERAGRTSKRMHTLDRLKHIVPHTDWTEDAKPLLFLDLKLGNICNLKCRICGSWSSSQFAVEDLKFTRLEKHETKESTYAYQMLQAGAWPRESQTFWQQIDQHLDQIRYIEFTGGEPFLIEQHFDMLRGIVDRGIAHQVEIHYNTNGTTYPEDAADIWKHFRCVEIAFSIDDVEERFEYQRTNAVWHEVVDNIKRFELLKKIHPNIQLQVCSTVNIFNVRYLDTLAAWLAQQSFDFVYWNVMHDAWYFSVACLPDSVKAAVAQHLNTANIPQQYRTDIQGVIDFMNRGASTDGFITRMKIADLDRKRRQNFAMVSPDMAKLLEYNLDDC